MQVTNLVTAANVNKMKCLINRMVDHIGVSVTYMQVEQAMSLFDYESEEVETIVFTWIRDSRSIIF